MKQKQEIETIQISTVRQGKKIVGEIIWKNGKRINIEVVKFLTVWKPPRLTIHPTT